MLNEEQKKPKAKKVKKHLWWIIPLVGVFLIVCVQFFWPAERARILFSIGGENAGFISKDELAEKIQNDFSASKIVLNFNGERSEFELARVGAEVDNSAIEKVFSYPLEQKIIPFSIFFKYEMGNIPLKFDSKKMSEFIEEYAKKRNVESKNATLFVDGSGNLAVEKAAPGIEISKSELRKEIEYINKSFGGKPEIEVVFARTGGDKNFNYNKIASDANKKLNKRVVVFSEQKIYTPIRADFAKWLEIKERENKDIFIEISKEKMQAFSNLINKDVQISAKDTIVDFVDGRESGRIEGEKGRRLNVDKLKDFLERFINGAGDVSNLYKIEYEDVSPVEQKKYTYTNTENGLQAKVNELGRRYDVRIDLKQLNGAGWSARYRESESTPSASTYKLFIALKLFDEMKAGRASWNSGILGTNTRECFRQMIMISVSECAEEWIRMFGRTNLNNFLYTSGFSGNTTFTSYDAVRTTAKDLRQAVEGVYNGSLADGENREILLFEMGRQIHRKGIPLGSAGKVYDKVGFLWDYTHDTAIVEHPRGKYTIAIMTKGSGYWAIAQIIRELESFMYP